MYNKIGGHNMNEKNILRQLDLLFAEKKIYEVEPFYIIVSCRRNRRRIKKHF